MNSSLLNGGSMVRHILNYCYYIRERSCLKVVLLNNIVELCMDDQIRESPGGRS